MFSQVDAYGRHVGRYGAALAAAHITAADITPGQTALDVGCGPGALTEALAALLGPEHVAAVDPSPAFAAACAERVRGADVRVGSAEALPDFDRRFDAVLSQLVVNFMTDARAGVTAMRAASRPGGTVASCVWDYAGEMALLRAFWDAALELDAGCPDEGRTMRYCTPDELAGLWRSAGLSDVETAELRVGAQYADFDDLWSPFPTGLGPSGAYCAGLSAEGQARLRNALYERLGSPAGSFALEARAWFVRGTA